MKRKVICAVRLRNSAAVMVEASIETNRVSAVSPLPSRSVMAASKPSNTSRDRRFFNWRRSPSAKVVTIISYAVRAPVMKCLASKLGVGGGDGVEPGRDRRAGFGDVLPPLGGQSRSLGRYRPRWRFGRMGRRQRDDLAVGGGTAHGVARGIGIVRRPLAAGALAQYATQTQEYEHRERKKDDCVNVEHVWHLSASRTVRLSVQRGDAKPRFAQGTRFSPTFM